MAKGKPPRYILERRKGKPPTASGKPVPRDWKFLTGTGIGIAGLLLGGLTLADRPTVSLGVPLDPSNILSTEVTIINNGVLSIRNVSVDIYLKHAKMGGNVFDRGLMARYEIPTGILRPGEPKTADLSRMIHGGVKYQELDIALIAHFSPVWAPFWDRTRPFRFTTKQRADGTGFLEQIPAENIEDDYQKAMKEAVAHPKLAP